MNDSVTRMLLESSPIDPDGGAEVVSSVSVGLVFDLFDNMG